MMGVLKYFLYSFAISLAAGAPLPENPDTELILVSVIFRHGARTTYHFYPTDPNINETFYPFGLGGLTNEGKLGEYKLGTYFKNLYGSFLGDIYTEDMVDVRSTDVTRIKMSAQLVLAGLFPPNEIQKWNENLNWQPIPVSYKSDAEEDIFHPWASCPYKKRVLEDLPNDPEVQEIFIKPYNETYQFIQKMSGKPIRHPADVQDIYFIFQTENDMNLKMPEWIAKVYPEPAQTLAANVFAYHNYDPRVRHINSGYMLKKILEDSRKKIEGVSQKKIYLYSGHESTLGYMLNALNVSTTHIPPYGSAISFELHKANNEFYIKLRYRNDTEATEPVDLIIPRCEVLCPFDQFLELNKGLIPNIPVEEACEKRPVDAAQQTNFIK